MHGNTKSNDFGSNTHSTSTSTTTATATTTTTNNNNNDHITIMIIIQMIIILVMTMMPMSSRCPDRRAESQLSLGPTCLSTMSACVGVNHIV